MSAIQNKVFEKVRNFFPYKTAQLQEGSKNSSRYQSMKTYSSTEVLKQRLRKLLDKKTTYFSTFF